VNVNPWHFKTGAFNRSAISPFASVYASNWIFSTEKTQFKYIFFGFGSSMVPV